MDEDMEMGGNWEKADSPVTDEMNGRMVRAIIGQSVIWQFTNPETDEKFPAPVFMVELMLRNGESFQCSLPPGAASSLLAELADHVATVWGGVPGSDAIDLSDDALDKLMNDLNGGE